MFIVLTLLGADLARLRNEMPNRHFTVTTAVRVAMQTASAIEELHKTGFSKLNYFIAQIMCIFYSQP